MRPRLTVAATLAAVMGGALTFVSAEPAVTSEPTLGPLVSGTSAYVDGTYVWTDYAYDDHGANTSAGTVGSAAYPDPGDQGNAADLIQLQAELDDAGRLSFTAVLETLTRPDRPLLGIGLDTDSDTATGAASVPGGQWTSSGALGLDYFLTASSEGAALTRWDGSDWQPMATLPARVDLADNTISTTVPAGVLPATGQVRAVAALGLRRDEASWMAGNGPIFDLAFVRAEEPAAGPGMLVSAEVVYVTGRGHATGGAWQDIRQADVLAGHLPASEAVATIDLDAMWTGRTSLPRIDTPGYHTMMYRSAVALPEGIVPGTAAGGLWAGPYQPYLVQVPPNPSANPPVLLYLHGGGGTHLDNGLFAPQGGLSIGEAIAVFPYGRKTTTAHDHGYQGESEQDVLDVLEDVRRHYPTDPNRTVVMGVSTGGGGAFRMAQLHPDLFSGVLVMSAYDDTHVPENLINMPVVLHNGGTDPAVSPPIVALTHKELDDFGNIGYRSYLLAGHGHGDPAAAVSQCLVDQLLRKPVVRDPARVVLALDPSNDPPDLPAGVRLNHGDAYWLSDVRVRVGAPASIYRSTAGTPLGDNQLPAYGDNAVARIDVTSLAYAVRTAVATPVEEVGENITAGATLCGPDAATQTNDVWRVHGVDLSPGAPQPTGNAATVAMREVSTATLDLPRMGLSTGQPLTLEVSGDGETSLGLIGPWGDSVQLWIDGARVGDLQLQAGRLTVTADVAGDRTIRLVPFEGSTPTAAAVGRDLAASESLPATGLDRNVPLAAGVLILLAMSALLVRHSSAP